MQSVEQHFVRISGRELFCWERTMPQPEVIEEKDIHSDFPIVEQSADLNSEFRIPNSEIPSKGRLLGVDFGTVRVGLAVCDPDRIVASPLATYKRRTEEKDIEYFLRVVKNENIVALVVGLPISLDCTEGPKAKEAREYGAWLAKTTNMPLTFWDERFTTAIAEEAMIDAGLTNQKRKERRDRVAAQIMLQAFLQQGSPKV